MLVKMNGADDGGQSVGNMLKPYMTRGDIQIIGATTNEEFTKHMLPDKAFCSRFSILNIKEPTKAATKEILTGMLPIETAFFKREVQEELVDKIIALSDKYALEYANPRKSINMLELACAYSRVFEEKKQVVDPEDIINSIKLRYNIYISDDKIRDTKEGFKQVLGQEDAVNQIMRDLDIVDAEITDPQRPALSMLFCGPSGTGKTFCAEIIAKTFFGSEENIVKLNMGEYSSEMDVSKLVGSAAGYVGFDTEPALIKGVREKPCSIILFDEIEKAHRSVQKTLLNILDKGEMQDNKGNRVSFRNNIIIFTTNLGCTHETGHATGMGLVKISAETSDKARVEKAIKDYFSPEFLGRLDDIVYYKGLTKDVLSQLVDRYVNEYKSRSVKEEVRSLELSDADKETIYKEAKVETQGARGIRKAVQKQLAKMYHDAKLKEEKE